MVNLYSNSDQNLFECKPSKIHNSPSGLHIHVRSWSKCGVDVSAATLYLNTLHVTWVSLTPRLADSPGGLLSLLLSSLGGASTAGCGGGKSPVLLLFGAWLKRNHPKHEGLLYLVREKHNLSLGCLPRGGRNCIWIAFWNPPRYIQGWPSSGSVIHSKQASYKISTDRMMHLDQLISNAIIALILSFK